MMELELSMPLKKEEAPIIHVSTAVETEKQTTNTVPLGSTSVPAKFNLVTANNCPHMVKSLSLAGLRKGFKTDVKPYCHPCTFKSKSADLKLNLSWVCLQCGNIACGDINAQNGDAMRHFKTPRSDLHSIVVQLGEEYRSWCFTCQSELNSHNAHLKDGVVFIKKLVKGKFAYELGARKKQIEESGDFSSIPLRSLPAPPPIPPAPKAYSHKQNNYGKNNSVGKFSKPGQNGGDIGELMTKPLGLENLGNTCFMNAALQCLSRTKLLIPKLDLFGSGINVPVLVTPTGDSQAKIIVLNGSEMQGDIPSALTLPEESSQWDKPFVVDLEISPESMTARLKHTLKAITRQGEVRNGNKQESFYCGVRPYDVHNMISKSFKPGAQHDSHELLRSIVDMLKKDQTRAFRAGIMKKFGVAKGGEGSDPKVVEFVKSLDQKVKHQTFVDEIFGGELMTTQTCLTCNFIKRSHEEFLDLSLPLRVSKGNQSNQISSNSTSTYISSSSFLDYSENENIVINRTVEECLNSLTEPELLTGSNIVECENCHKINLEKVQNGAAFEDVFPNIQTGKAISKVEQMGTSSQKSVKGKLQDDRKKRRPSRQSRIKNQISRNAQETNQSPSYHEIKNLQPREPPSLPPQSLLKNDLASGDVSWIEKNKSNIDDFVVVSQADVDILSPTNCSKRKFTDVDDMDIDDCGVTLLDSHTDFGLAGPSQDLNTKSDEECEGDADSDLPSAADGVGGSTSDVEDNDVPPIDLDLPDYDKFDHFHVPQLATAGTTDLDMEKATADEGYSEGSGGTESALVAGTTAKERQMTQSLSQESSCQNSISDPEENSKDGSEGTAASGEIPVKEPPITKCPCSRQQSISRPPKFLTIHLKRFQISPRGYTSKLSDHVDFPIMLDLTRYCAVSSEETKDQVFDEDGQVMYSLYGIVEHSGSLHWGHYVAYIRVPAAEPVNGEIQKDTWYYISDSQVSFYSENNITLRDPYILFYERVRGETKRAREKLLNQQYQLQNNGGYFGSTNGWESSSSTTKPDQAGSWEENWKTAWDEEFTKQSTQVYGPLPASEMPDREIETYVGRAISPPEKMDGADSAEDEDDFYIPPLPGFEDICDDNSTLSSSVWNVESGINGLTNLNLNLDDVTEMGDGIEAESDPTGEATLWQTYTFFNTEAQVSSETGLPWGQYKESTPISTCEAEISLRPQCSEDVMEVETHAQSPQIPVLSAMNYIDDSSEEIQ